jgi:hypothetical protein
MYPWQGCEPLSILGVRATPRDGNGTVGWIVQSELLKKKKCGQLPDESTKIKGSQSHSVGAPRSTKKSMHK